MEYPISIQVRRTKSNYNIFYRAYSTYIYIDYNLSYVIEEKTLGQISQIPIFKIVFLRKRSELQN